MTTRWRREVPLGRVSRVTLAVAARFVPRHQRDEWRREWEAELVYAALQDPNRRAFKLHRVLLSIPDALLLRVRGTPAAHDREAMRNGATAIWEDLMRNLSVSMRALAKQPAFAGLVIATMGLGIGAATTIFGLVNGVLLKPLSYPEPDRLVAVWPARWFSGALFDLLHGEATSYEMLAAWGPRSYREVDDAGARRVFGARATAGFFRVLGTDPAIGRTFVPDDDQEGSPGGVVLSNDFWRRRFGGDSAVIGTRLRVLTEVVEGGLPILGVMPHGFAFQPGFFSEARGPADFAITVPFDRSATGYQSSEFKVIGRLKPGVTLQQAQAELESRMVNWRERFGLPDTFGNDASIQPLKEFIVGDTKPTVLLLFGAVGLILVIATINVANLLLARALTRRREVSVRLALGATPGRIVRQLITESTLLGLCGSAVGLALAAVGVSGVRSLLPPDTPRLETVGLDATVLGFSVALALLTGWTSGLLPGLQLRKADLLRGLGGDTRGVTAGRRRNMMRSALLASEIGLAVVLLTTSGGLAKSFWHLTELDPGFGADGLINLHVIPAPGRLTSLEQAERYYRLVDEGLEAIPGVQAAAAISQAPVTGDGGIVNYYPADTPPEEGADHPTVRWRAVSPDYFATAEIDLVVGRGFTVADAEGERVVVLSVQAAEELFGDRSPLGQRVVTGFEREPVTVVGVVRDIRLLGPAETSLPMVYRPYAQTGSVFERFRFISRGFVLRTQLDASDLSGPVSEAVRSVDGYALVTGFEPVVDAIAMTLSERRATLVMLVFFAAGALVLGGVGIYGVTGYVVRARRRELGVRIAVGASSGRIISEVLWDVLKVAGVGVALGVVVTLALSRILQGFVVDVSAIDPWVYGLAVAVSVALAVAAGFIPARLAGRTDPIEVLTADG